MNPVAANGGADCGANAGPAKPVGHVVPASGALRTGTRFAASGVLRCSAGGCKSAPVGSSEIGPSSLTFQAEPGLGSTPPPMIEVPFISQIAGVPSVFCQMMSALPSPLKSLGPITCHDDPGLISTPPAMVEVPFISQIAGIPLLFCHRMSSLPSPLKSPAPITCHDGPGLVSTAPPMIAVPSISQTAA